MEYFLTSFFLFFTDLLYFLLIACKILRSYNKTIISKLQSVLVSKYFGNTIIHVRSLHSNVF